MPICFSLQTPTHGEMVVVDNTQDIYEYGPEQKRSALFGLIEITHRDSKLRGITHHQVITVAPREDRWTEPYERHYTEIA